MFAMRKIILICIHIWLDKTCLHSNTASTWVQSRFLVKFVLLIFLFSFLCCVCLFYVFIVLFVFVRFIVCRMLRVSLDCPSLIIPQFSLSLTHMHMLMPDAVLCFWCWFQEFIYNVCSLHLSSSLFELMIYWYHLWIRLNVWLCDIFILTFF